MDKKNTVLSGAFYFLPPHYIMQGLIADTGDNWKLYKRQHEAHSNSGGLTRRLIFLKIENVTGNGSSDMFSINARRIPMFMADIDIHNLRLHAIKMLPADTGWGSVPTPVF